MRPGLVALFFGGASASRGRAAGELWGGGATPRLAQFGGGPKEWPECLFKKNAGHHVNLNWWLGLVGKFGLEAPPNHQSEAPNGKRKHFGNFGHRS